MARLSTSSGPPWTARVVMPHPSSWSTNNPSHDYRGPATRSWCSRSASTPSNDDPPRTVKAPGGRARSCALAADESISPPYGIRRSLAGAWAPPPFRLAGFSFPCRSVSVARREPWSSRLLAPTLPRSRWPGWSAFQQMNSRTGRHSRHAQGRRERRPCQACGSGLPPARRSSTVRRVPSLDVRPPQFGGCAPRRAVYVFDVGSCSAEPPPNGAGTRHRGARDEAMRFNRVWAPAACWQAGPRFPGPSPGKQSVRGWLRMVIRR
jgi:hypothetical protein